MGKVIGFDNESDFERMGRSVVKSENTPQAGARRRAKFPVGGGGSSDPGFVLMQPVDICDGIGLWCDCSVGKVIIAGCGSPLSVGDETNFWDPGRNFLQLPQSLLLTSFFFAHKMDWEPLYGTEFDLPGNCEYVITGAYCTETTIFT